MKKNGYLGAGLESKIGAFTGYKALCLTKPNRKKEVFLVSPHQNVRMIHGVQSECNNLKHAKNLEDCTCGYHAYKIFSRGLMHLREFGYSPYIFLARVKCSGEVVVYDEGYRSTHQRIEALQITTCGFQKNNEAHHDVIKFIAQKGIRHKLLTGVCNECLNKIKNQRKNKYVFYDFKEIESMLNIDGFSEIQIVKDNQVMHNNIVMNQEGYS